jgi:hypothetical protein
MKASPNGIPVTKRYCASRQQGEGGWTAYGLACWSLIGKIGTEGTPFEVGKLLEYTVPASQAGELYLGFNDSYYPDNEGSYNVQVSAFET